MSIAEPGAITESAQQQTTEMTRIVLSSVIGTAVEWYDFLDLWSGKRPRLQSGSFRCPILRWAPLLRSALTVWAF